VNYDISFVVTTITVTCYSWAYIAVNIYLHVAPSTGRHSTAILRLLTDAIKSGMHMISHFCDCTYLVKMECYCIKLCSIPRGKGW